MIDFWTSGQLWAKSAYNTMWCLIGCAIGDLGTIAYFQFTGIPWHTLYIMLLAMTNGLITSIVLETFILMRRQHFPLITALRTAMGMSFLSMLAMEAAMNTTDFIMTGGALLTPTVILPMLLAGFITPWPYNYWRLKKLGLGCCH
ncbi:MAG: DUF4396 domain-containing protein [Chromatiales bacterium]|nr:DUF4396 domain-containing protein [Chromatiales bacterium]